MMAQTYPEIEMQAQIHHQLFLGLQLMVAVEESRQTVFDWMFTLFRQQHEAKFLSSFEKLGLQDEPHAVACAKYHVLSNNIGGVGVEYMAEGPHKAWVRFRYPRWMYAGPAICGIPIEAGRGFLYGWYAQNGVSLGNSRLGFVCVSEDVTGQYGLCGYFKEYDHDLDPEERLVFAPNEIPPPYKAAEQPTAPAAAWTPERLAKANRNYAIEYIRNGVDALAQIVGDDRARQLCGRAARLIGLQQGAHLRERLGVADGGVRDSADLLAAAMRGLGDSCAIQPLRRHDIAIVHTGLRIARALPAPRRDLLLSCWIELWRGVVQSARQFQEIKAVVEADQIVWHLSERTV